MKHLFFVLLGLTCFSCFEKQDNTYVYENVSRFYDDGKPQIISKFKDSIEVYQKHYFPSGVLFMEGSVDKGKRTGKWTSYHENGTTNSIGFFDQNMRTGEVKCFYNNGQLQYSGEFHRNQKTGTWTFYDKNGAVLKTESF